MRGDNTGTRHNTPVRPVVTTYYHATTALDEQALAAHAALLDGEERGRCNRLLFARDRRDYTAAHALVRRALSRHGDLPETAWTFERGPLGKPSITIAQRGSPPLVFNLSHTEGLVACAVGTALELGVDVESVAHGDDQQQIAEYCFAPSEIATLLRRSGDERRTRFIELWVLKEAYVKAVGSGLSHPLGSFAFELTGQDGLRFVAPSRDSAARWQFALFAVGQRYRLAVAARAYEATRPIAFELHDLDQIGPEVVLLRRTSR